MAKSTKKPEAKTTHSAEKKPAAASTKKTATATTASAKSDAKPQAAKAKSSSHQTKTSAPATRATPLIDTSLAASSAASMIGAGLGAKNRQPGTPSGKPESSLFKQMKSGLNKPTSSAMDSLLDKTHGPGVQKGNAFQKQVGHNQTTGSAAARINVPRRTAG